PLEGWGVPRPVAAVLAVIVVLGVFTALILLTWPTLQGQTEQIRERLPEAIGSIRGWLAEQSTALSGSLGEAGDGMEDELRERMRGEVAGMVGGTLPLLNSALGAVSGLFLVLFAAVFLAASPKVYADGLAGLLPGVPEARTHAALAAIGRTLRKWLQATALSGLVILVLSTVGLTLLGVPAALALGVIAAIMAFVPYVGPILSAIPAVAMAFVTGPDKAVWVIVLYIAIQAVESNLLQPLLMKGLVKLEPALTILFQAMMATLFGFLGLLLAVPILASAKALLAEWRAGGATA
ncbi:MAG TPA: AI-2E family transporter, partial [Gemmatimonadaceae bacterium]|nr:AI-2E family transporter [Gemmatimonadaceae bacterium]